MPLLRIRSEGRGTHYPPWLGLLEMSLRTLYRGDWPARIWGRVPAACDVATVHMALEVLPPGAPRLRLGFVSDLHLGPTTPRRLLDHAFDRLAESDLDVLLLGGDYVSLEATDEKAQQLATLVTRVPARRKLAVLGNHDLWSRHAILESALRGVGVDVLCNESRTFDGPHQEIALVGLDDPWTGTLDTATAFRNVGTPEAIVILCHSPEGVPAAIQQLEKLARIPPTFFICGHTHGGQIAAPWGPVIVP
jgi:predicted MPP superfamily phosphohydrolase